MCVVGLAWKAHPRWHLIMAGNRDEFHGRPTLPLARWSDPGHVIGGRDLQSGGMWLGVSDEGRFAVVTNISNPAGPDPEKASRGALVTDWLNASAIPDPDTLSSFNPFHLLVASTHQATHISNQPARISEPLLPGIHMLSNGKSGEFWPRMSLLEFHLADWLSSEASDLHILFDALGIENWPDRNPGPMPDSDRHHPPIFIKNPTYGTRASTIVAIDTGGRGVIIERHFGPDGNLAGQSEVAFSWPLGH